MSIISKLNITRSNYFSFILALFPLSFIAGNMIINANIILLIFSTLILIGKQSFNIKYQLLDKLIISFFFLILITGFANDYQTYVDRLWWKGYFSVILKSIYFLKYLMLYIFLRFLIENKIINLKLFFIFSSLGVLFVSLDVLYQYIFGQDIFGFETIGSGRKLGGPFGDELIAGGYIQRFSLFVFFTLPLFFNYKDFKFIKFLIPILLIIILIGLIFSGNRMPLLLFLLIIFLISIFQKQIRKFLIPFISIFIIVFTLGFNFNKEIKTNFLIFFNEISKMTTIIINRDAINEKSPQYIREFATFYDTWQMNKYIGGGIKNFRYYCHVRPNLDKNSVFKCNMHPHNYYLEILTETGLIGFILISVIFTIILYKTLYKKYFIKSALNDNVIIIPFIFLFIAEIFPIKSTGSFFTTGNATYLFLIMALLIGISEKYNSIDKRL